MEGNPSFPHHANEFYTWLWWTSEQQEGLIIFSEEGETESIESTGSCELWVDSRMAFGNPSEMKPSAVLTGDNPSITPEARAALLSGKAMQELRIGIRIDDREFYVTLKDSPMMLKAARLPQILSDGAEEILRDRMYLLEELDRILARLFTMFATQRVSSAWAQDILPQIQMWAGEET